MSEARRFDNLRAHTELGTFYGLGALAYLRKAPTDLRHFQCVLLAGVEHIGFSSPDNLRYPREPPKRRGIKDAIPVALKRYPLIVVTNAMAPTTAVAV